MIHTYRGPYTATHIHPATPAWVCRRCGITITSDRHHYYGNTCNDCTGYIPVTRKRAA